MHVIEEVVVARLEWAPPKRIYHLLEEQVVYELLKRGRVVATITRSGSRYTLHGRCKDGRTLHGGFKSSIAARAYGDRNLTCMKERPDGRKEEAGEEAACSAREASAEEEDSARADAG